MKKINAEYDLFKITFEHLKTRNKGYFFVNGIEKILNQEVFSKEIKCTDGKTIVIKNEILRQLEKPE